MIRFDLKKQNELLHRLQELLQSQANPKTKIWWENYLKQVIPFRGVKIADIRKSLHQWLQAESIQSELTPDEQKSLALALIKLGHAEDKLAGILYLQEVLIPQKAIAWMQDLDTFANLFDEGYIYDWSTCDWFCVRVLGPLAQKEGKKCAGKIASWRTAENLWRRRAAGVAFINYAAKGDKNFPGFSDMLFTVCSETVKHSERFSQTGTGWVLRELSVADLDRTRDFIAQHLHYFSAEGLRYATEKMNPTVKVKFKEMHKKLSTK